MIKRIYLVILVMLFAAPGLFAQTPTIYIEDVEADPGEILVPVFMKDFENLLNFDLYIKIDTEVLEFIGVENVAFDEGQIGATYDNAKQAIKIMWMKGSLPGVDLEDGKLLDLKLNYQGGFVTYIDFDTEESIFYNAALGTIDDVSFEGGFVFPKDFAGRVSMTTVEAVVNETVDMPVTFEGDGFDAVSSFTLRIAIDQTQLEFASATLVEGIEGVLEATENNGEIRVVWTGEPVDFSGAEEPVHVLDIKVIYKGGGEAAMRFKGTSQVTANLGTLSTEFIDGRVGQLIEDDALLTISDSFAFVERVVDETVDPPLVTLVPDEVSVTISAEEILSEVASVNLVIGFDNTNLSFESFTAHQLTQWSVNAIGNRVYVVRNSITGAAIEDGDLITLTFGYADNLSQKLQDGESTFMQSPITFRGGSEMRTESLISIPFATENGSITVTNQTFELILMADPEDGGEVTGAGIYRYGEVAEVDAEANEGFEFVDWTLPDGTFVSDLTANEIPMLGDLTLVANFKMSEYTLTLVANPEEGGEVVGAGVYTLFDEIEVDAIPAEGYAFVNWTDADGEVVSEEAANVLPGLTTDLTLTANFELIDYTLTLVANPEEGGEVTGAGVYNFGDVVSVDAIPAEGYAFVNWTDADGDVVSEQAANDIPMPSSDLTLTANFELVDYTLTLLVAPEGAGTVVGAGTYNFGDEVEVDAIPNEGFAFVNWTDADGEEVSTSPDNLITMPAGDLTLTANFVALYNVTFNVNMMYVDGYYHPLTFNAATDVVYVTGGMFGWQQPGEAPDLQTMAPTTDDPMIYTVTVQVAPGDYPYKYFINAGWDNGEWDGGDDRTFSVVDADVVLNDWFGSRTDPTNVSKPEAVSLNVYPNPARTVVNIESGKEILEVRMMDMLGQLVYTSPVNSYRTQLSVSELKNGIYFVQVLTSEGFVTHRVQVTK